MIKPRSTSTRDVQADITPARERDLSIGIFISRVEQKAFAVILNRTNKRWAPLTVGEHDMVDDNFDALFDAVNEVQEDIVRWAEHNVDEPLTQ